MSSRVTVSVGCVTRVLVTGSAGNLGSKALAALRALPEVAPVGLDRDGADVVGDLDEFGDWAEAFAGADVVLHLAAQPKPTASWSMVVRSNIDASLNVLRAAELHRVPRVVFASSNWVLGGYRFRDDRLTP